jgi:septum formation protein
VTLSPFILWPADSKLVLASRSPRRAELLQVAGIPFDVRPAATDESKLAAAAFDRSGASAPADDPVLYGRKLAEAKATEVAGIESERLVLGADTVVVLDGEILGKPRDRDEAVRMLRRLSGRRHVVVTAIALIGPPLTAPWCGHEQTRVEFFPLSDGEIRRYVATEEPLDKAGAYGIQGFGALMVRRIEGCYFNVMGLPLGLLGRKLRELFAAVEGP